jgi:ABC-type Mn2+/Zn2+ transport system permease subunit
MLAQAGVYLFFVAAVLTTATLGLVVGALATLAANRRFSMKSAALDAALATAAAFAATLVLIDRDLARDGALRPHEGATLAAAAVVVLARHALARLTRPARKPVR